MPLPLRITHVARDTTFQRLLGSAQDFARPRGDAPGTPSILRSRRCSSTTRRLSSRRPPRSAWHGARREPSSQLTLAATRSTRASRDGRLRRPRLPQLRRSLRRCRGTRRGPRGRPRGAELASGASSRLALASLRSGRSGPPRRRRVGEGGSTRIRRSACWRRRRSSHLSPRRAAPRALDGSGYHRARPPRRSARARVLARPMPIMHDLVPAPSPGADRRAAARRFSPNAPGASTPTPSLCARRGRAPSAASSDRRA